MANEVGFSASIGGKQQALAVAYPLGTETVATAIGSADCVVIFSAAALNKKSLQLQNLVRQIVDRAQEVEFDETRLPDA